MPARGGRLYARAGRGRGQRIEDKDRGLRLSGGRGWRSRMNENRGENVGASGTESAQRRTAARGERESGDDGGGQIATSRKRRRQSIAPTPASCRVRWQGSAIAHRPLCLSSLSNAADPRPTLGTAALSFLLSSIFPSSLSSIRAASSLLNPSSFLPVSLLFSRDSFSARLSLSGSGVL